MAAFAEALKGLAARIPEARVLMILGTDGMPVEKLLVSPEPNLETVAAEYAALLKSGLAVAADTDAGQLRELALLTENMATLLVTITPEYFLFAGLAPDAIVGRARYALRTVGHQLAQEFV